MEAPHGKTRSNESPRKHHGNIFKATQKQREALIELVCTMLALVLVQLPSNGLRSTYEIYVSAQQSDIHILVYSRYTILSLAGTSTSTQAPYASVPSTVTYSHLICRTQYQSVAPLSCVSRCSSRAQQRQTTHDKKSKEIPNQNVPLPRINNETMWNSIVYLLSLFFRDQRAHISFGHAEVFATASAA